MTEDERGFGTCGMVIKRQNTILVAFDNMSTEIRPDLTPQMRAMKPEEVSKLGPFMINSPLQLLNSDGTSMLVSVKGGSRGTAKIVHYGCGFFATYAGQLHDPAEMAKVFQECRFVRTQIVQNMSFCFRRLREKYVKKNAIGDAEHFGEFVKIMSKEVDGKRRVCAALVEGYISHNLGYVRDQCSRFDAATDPEGGRNQASDGQPSGRRVLRWKWRRLRQTLSRTAIQ